MKNSLVAPTLNKGEYSVIKVDVNTGHILQTNGDLYTGKGEVFKLFIGLIDAEDFIDKEITCCNNLEFVIYDCNGQSVKLINRFQSKQIE